MSVERWLVTNSHPIVSRLYDPVMAIPERMVLPEHRTSLATGLSGRVLDLGAGTGAMFPYVAEQDDVALHGLEPDPHMRRQARNRATELGLSVTMMDARAESLPYDDDSFDYVVASLVFCTIPDQEAALDEIARVLRPGGEFRFLEHVRASGIIGRVHDFVAPAWHLAAGGCHLNRKTGELFLADNRFELVEFGEISNRFVPMIRGTLRRRTDSSSLRGYLDRIRG